MTLNIGLNGKYCFYLVLSSNVPTIGFYLKLYKIKPHLVSNSTKFTCRSKRFVILKLCIKYTICCKINPECELKVQQR